MAKRFIGIAKLACLVIKRIINNDRWVINGEAELSTILHFTGEFWAI
jgi:hypothetical protein